MERLDNFLRMVDALGQEAQNDFMNVGMNLMLAFDEPRISLDEKKNISCQVAWDFQICFSIFIAKSTPKGGFQPLIRKQTNLFL